MQRVSNHEGKLLIHFSWFESARVARPLHEEWGLSHLATQRDRHCVNVAAIARFVNHTAGQPGLAGQPGFRPQNKSVLHKAPRI